MGEGGEATGTTENGEEKAGYNRVVYATAGAEKVVTRDKKAVNATGTGGGAGAAGAKRAAEAAEMALKIESYSFT